MSDTIFPSKSQQSTTNQQPSLRPSNRMTFIDWNYTIVREDMKDRNLIPSEIQEDEEDAGIVVGNNAKL